MTFRQNLGAFLKKVTPLNTPTFNLMRFEIGCLWRRALHPFSIKRRKTINSLRKQSELSINVGSGGKGESGWVNIDIFLRPDSTFDLDIRQPIPLTTGSARRILAEHVVEHLDFYDDIPSVLKEFHRLLQIGGILRIVVPDAERYLKIYCNSDQNFAELGYDLIQLADKLPTPMALINHMFHQYGEHHFAYDFETLQWCLIQAGFKKIRRCSYRKSVDPALRIDQPNHEPYSLYVEAER